MILDAPVLSMPGVDTIPNREEPHDPEGERGVRRPEEGEALREVLEAPRRRWDELRAGEYRNAAIQVKFLDPP